VGFSSSQTGLGKITCISWTNKKMTNYVGITNIHAKNISRQIGVEQLLEVPMTQIGGIHETSLEHQSK
jgi:hypothetical protein